MQTGHRTYFQLQQDNNRLQEQVTILECQKKTVVVYNRQQGTFEYIGEPICLKLEHEIDDLQTLVQEIRNWLDANPRLTVAAIFEQADSHGYGELTQRVFEQCFAKLGIRLRAKELALLTNALDHRGIGQIAYRPLLRELSGIPQAQFVPPLALKLAKAAEHRDLSLEQLKKLIDPESRSPLTLHDFQTGLAQLNSESFSFTQEEASALFKVLTKSPDPIGLKVDIQQVAELIQRGQDALMFERIRDGVNKSSVSLGELFSKHDTNKDSFLELAQIDDFLLELRVFLNPNALQRLKGILDADAR